MKKTHSKIPARLLTSDLNFDKEIEKSKILKCSYDQYNFNLEVFNFLLTELEVNSTPFEDFIANQSIFIPRESLDERERFEEYHLDYICKLNELYTNFKRTPENIANVFNENTINHIANLFNNKLLFKDYKIYTVLKGLLLTYEEMDDYECNRLGELLRLEEEDYGLYGQECRNAFNDRVSEDLKTLLFEGEYFKKNTGKEFDYEKRVFYLYSFWARRYKEKNKEVVFEILKKLDDKIK